MNRPTLFKKRDLDRALQSVSDAGLSVSGIEFDEKGFRLRIGADNDGESEASKALNNWRKKNANPN